MAIYQFYPSINQESPWVFLLKFFIIDAPWTVSSRWSMSQSKKQSVHEKYLFARERIHNSASSREWKRGWPKHCVILLFMSGFLLLFSRERKSGAHQRFHSQSVFWRTCAASASTTPSTSSFCMKIILNSKNKHQTRKLEHRGGALLFHFCAPCMQTEINVYAIFCSCLTFCYSLQIFRSAGD